MLSVLQSQFIEKGVKKTKNSEQDGVLLLFLYMLAKKKNQTNGRIKTTCQWSHKQGKTDLGVDPLHASVDVTLTVTIEVDRQHVLWPSLLPRIAVAQPLVRLLQLPHTCHFHLLINNANI